MSINNACINTIFLVTFKTEINLNSNANGELNNTIQYSNASRPFSVAPRFFSGSSLASTLKLEDDKKIRENSLQSLNK
jgi:hypothetical protein